MASFAASGVALVERGLVPDPLVRAGIRRLLRQRLTEIDEGDWMSRVFFSGGMMPSDNLSACFQEQLRLASRWRIDGTHYARTLDAWLANMDRERAALLPIVSATYGAGHTERWWNRWRIFFMACSELFAYRGGQEWYVGHYRFERR